LTDDTTVLSFLMDSYFTKECTMDIGLLLLRLAVGLTLAAHGAQKLFGWFGGPGLAGTGGFFEKLGFVPGKRSALLAGLAELGGGVALAVGLATPLASAAALAVMLVATVSVHLKKGFFLSKGGFEYNLVLGLAALSLSFTGPGLLSLDHLLDLVPSWPYWGLVSLAVGLGGAAFQLVMRRFPAEAGVPSLGRS
jgi:putative oxidoreductase